MGKPKTPDGAPEDLPLNIRQQAFINYYLQSWNATDAAIKAGYSEKTAAGIGYENLNKPHIRKEIDARLAALKMSADEVLVRLSQFAAGTLKPFLTPDGDTRLDTETAQDNIHLLKKVRKRQKRTSQNVIEESIEIEIHDPQTALIHLGRYHKLFTERHEHTGADGGPIRVSRALTDEELARIIDSET